MRQLVIWRNRFRKFRDYPPALIPFLKKHLYYNWVADSYLHYYKDVHFLNYDETIDTLIRDRRSFVRFGDDVFDMVQGIGLYFNDWRQRYEPDLAMRLQQVLRSRNERLLIGFNPELILLDRAAFKAQGIPHEYQYWTNSKIFMKDYINPGQTYGSTLCFQERYNKNIDYDRILRHLEKQHLVIVASNISRFNNASLGITTDYIEGPSSDAWDAYDDLLSATRNALSRYPIEKSLVLSALGPTTKVMTYDLTTDGYTVWDTGQLFDLALNRLV